MRGKTSLPELAFLFLRLGTTAFGGPAAHVAMMQDEVVKRRSWMTDEHFLDLVSATNLIPGPNSTELAIHIGFERRRWAGLWVAGVCFVVPATVITALFGWAYVKYGQLPAVGWVLYGIKPVILAVVVQAIWALIPKAARDGWLSFLGTVAAGLAAIGVNELLVLFGAGLISVIGAKNALRRRGAAGGEGPLEPPQAASHLLTLAPAAVGAAAATQITLPSLFFVFLKTGSVLFGSGYVLLAFLRADLVERLGWLTESQLIDAIAVGQITPGPVFSTATFIGYLLAGPGGALAATVGIFLPAFVFVALSGPLVPKIRRSPWASAFLDGVNVASLALMAVVTAQLGKSALIDVATIMLCAVSAILMLRFKLNSTWLVLGGAAAGGVLHLAGLAA